MLWSIDLKSRSLVVASITLPYAVDGPEYKLYAYLSERRHANLFICIVRNTNVDAAVQFSSAAWHRHDTHSLRSRVLRPLRMQDPKCRLCPRHQPWHISHPHIACTACIQMCAHQAHVGAQTRTALTTIYIVYGIYVVHEPQQHTFKPAGTSPQ